MKEIKKSNISLNEGIITNYDINGFGVTKLNDKVIFVKNALVGEKVIYKITNELKKYAFAESIKILTKSKNRVKPECIYFKDCGGCDLWHMNYNEEKIVKENKVKMTLKNVIKPTTKFNNIITSNIYYGYRNKVMLPFSKDEEYDTICGFYKKNTHEVIDVDKCLISSDIANRISYIVKRYLNIFNISIYDEEKHSGIFRELMIRESSINEIMVVFVLTKEYDLSGLIKLLIDEIKDIKSIYYNINDKFTNVVLSDKYIKAYGSDTIYEDILGLKFMVSPASFMQVNHIGCELLYAEALRLARLDKSMNVIDAYCGIGSITLNIARYVNHVYGIEVVLDAIDNAKCNMKLNNIDNATFIHGKCEDEISKLANLDNINIVFVDPPRKGCDESFLATLVKMNINKIVYISCNVSSLARDLAYLSKFGYEVFEVSPVDLFLRTSNVETVVLVTKTK